MEKYPEYVFGASQPQLYQWMKEGYPELYEQIKERIKEGRWEPQGAMWVEPDTNISGGEALVRQILYGKRFFELEFGQEMKVLWSARCIRLYGKPAADSCQIRCRIYDDPEIVLE